MSETTRKQQIDEAITLRLNEVVAPYRETKRLSWLANEIGRTEGALRSWLRGESMPNVVDIANLCDKTKVLLPWLVTGVGPKTIDEARTVAEQEDRRYVYSRDFILTIATAMEEEIAIAGLTFSPKKRAELLISFLYLFKPHDKIEREAIRMLIDHESKRDAP